MCRQLRNESAAVSREDGRYQAVNAATTIRRFIVASEMWESKLVVILRLSTQQTRKMFIAINHTSTTRLAVVRREDAKAT